MSIHNKNHPPTITTHMPAAINRRLSSISTDADTFYKAAPCYQKALRESGYGYQWDIYKPTKPNTAEQQKEKNGTLYISYNPPYIKNISINIGRLFLAL